MSSPIRPLQELERSRSARGSSLHKGFRVGRILGIEIQIDASWIFIFILVTWSLASGFGAMHRDWGPALDLGLALMAAFVFFGSVLTHELSHSLVATARGLPVKRITLFLFGGVSNIEKEPDSPSSEFLISVVGPVTSIVLGALFLAVAALLPGPRVAFLRNPGALLAGLGPAETMLLWLGSINVTLGLFNLVPGFPLDGGRILRSILWASTRDLHRATRIASRVGQFVGWAFVFCGIAMILGAHVPVFGSGVAGGLWIALIGWFLRNAAAASYRQLLIEDLLEDVSVAKLMRCDVRTVEPELPISELVYDFLLGTEDRAFPVVEGARLIGLVSIDDVRRVPRDSWASRRVAEIMTPAGDLAVIGPTQQASEALHKLTERDVRQLPVIENGRLVGLLRLRDILRWLRLQSGVVLS